MIERGPSQHGSLVDGVGQNASASRPLSASTHEGLRLAFLEAELSGEKWGEKGEMKTKAVVPA